MSLNRPHPQPNLERRQRQQRNLVIRNWLNGIFILLALLAIVGVLLFEAGDFRLNVSYGIAIVAVLIKMVEAMFRMPGVLTPKDTKRTSSSKMSETDIPKENRAN